jgi:UDP-2,3-diacylglucosamine pyrophosphatase LpxH
VSDLHRDFYPLGKNLAGLYKSYLNPKADFLAIAGDTSNCFDTCVKLLTELGKKYKAVYWVPGNHDLVIPRKNYEFIKNDSITNSMNYIFAIQEELPDNVHLLNGDVIQITEKTSIGGTIGYCDFEYAEKILKANQSDVWLHWQRWYDAVHIRLSRSDGEALWKMQLQKMQSIIEQKPTIMMTHFMPHYSLVHKKYASNILSSFFTFDGSNLLSDMHKNSGKYWVCGHTHDAFQKNINGIDIVCNPFGYPDERLIFGKPSDWTYSIE